MENNGGLMDYYQDLELRSLFERSLEPCRLNQSFLRVLLDLGIASNAIPSGSEPVSGQFGTGDCSTQFSFSGPLLSADEAETETLIPGSRPDSTALLNPDPVQFTMLTNLVEQNYRAVDYSCSGEADMRFQNSALDSDIGASNSGRIMVDDVSSTHSNMDVAMYVELPNSVEHSVNQRPGTSSSLFGGNQSQDWEPESQISSSTTCTTKETSGSSKRTKERKLGKSHRDQTQEANSEAQNTPSVSVGGRGNRSQVSGSARKESPRVTCMVCLKTYRDKTALKLHTYTHTGERPFLCPICGKRFQQNGHLTKHKLTHSRVRVF